MVFILHETNPETLCMTHVYRKLIIADWIHKISYSTKLDILYILILTYIMKTHNRKNK